MELIEVAPNVPTKGLVDFSVDIRFGVARWLIGVDNVVAL